VNHRRLGMTGVWALVSSVLMGVCFRRALIAGVLSFGVFATSVLSAMPTAAALETSKNTTLSDPAITHLLLESWQQYRATFIQDDGRVIDFNGNVTTSEGQAYAMLRAFWMRDKATFDKTYTWAKNNLQIPRGDHLFSWKWGQKSDKTWGALDRTSATDADQDIALALLLAWQVWHNDSYRADAKLILNELWERLTIEAPVGRVLLPGDWPALAQKGHVRQINPSYFAPASYRVFAEVDPDHDWLGVMESSYEILGRAMAQTQTHLPPDWVEVSLDNDAVSIYHEPLDSRSDFGYEAIRVYWKIALDALFLPTEKRAQSVLNTRTMLPRYWLIRQDVPISITWDGIVRHPQLESGAVYGAVLPALWHQDRTVADAVMAKKIVPSLMPGGAWNTKHDYYSQNWLWFGLALRQRDANPPTYARKANLARLADLLKISTGETP
jgi:endoglucanase